MFSIARTARLLGYSGCSLQYDSYASISVNTSTNSSLVWSIFRSSSLLKCRIRARWPSAVRRSSIMTWLSSFLPISASSRLISALTARPMVLAIHDHGLILMGTSWTTVKAISSSPPPSVKISFILNAVPPVCLISAGRSAMESACFRRLVRDLQVSKHLCNLLPQHCGNLLQRLFSFDNQGSVYDCHFLYLPSK